MKAVCSKTTHTRTHTFRQLNVHHSAHVAAAAHSADADEDDEEE